MDLTQEDLNTVWRLLNYRFDNVKLTEQLKKFTQEISSDLNDCNLLDKKYGIIKLLKRMIYLNEHLNNVKVVTNINMSIVISICRMILDTYSTIYILIDHGCKSEQYLRYLLFLKDGFKNKISITENFENNSKIGKEDININETLRSYTQSLDLINGLLKEYGNSLKPILIKKSKWRFKYLNQTNDSDYNWSQMHELAGIEKQYLKIFQDNFSEHIHGLAGIIIKDDLTIASTAIKTNANQTFNLLKLIHRNFKNEINPNVIDEEFLLTKLI